MSLEVQTIINDAHDQQILCVALDKQKHLLYSAGQDALIKVWDTESGRLTRVLKAHKGWVSDMVFIPFARTLVSGSVDGTLMCWSDTGKELQTMDFGGAVFCMNFNAKRRTLAVGGNGTMTIYRVTRPDPYEVSNLGKSSYIKVDSDSLKVLKTMITVQTHSDVIKGIVCADNGRIFSAGYDKSICMYDSERPKEACIRYEKCHDGAICSVTFDMENNWLVTGSFDGTVKMWSQEGRCLDVFDGLADTVTGLTYVHTTKTYWVTGKQKHVVAYDPRTPANITTYIKDTSRFDDFTIFKLHQVPMADSVVGVTTDRKLVVWRYNPSAAFRTLNGHQDWVEALTIVRRREDPSAVQVYSAGSDGLILRWTPSSAVNGDLYAIQEELSGHEGAVQCVVYSEEMDLLISASEDLSIRIWELGTPAVRMAENGDVEEKKDLNILLGHEGRITGLACCSDQVLASVSHDKTIRFWDLHTRHEIDVVERAHDTPIHCLEYCEQHEELATCASEPIVKIWCSFKHSLKLVLAPHQADVSQVKWCAWKSCWVTSAEDGYIRMWDRDGVVIKQFTFRGDSVTAMYIDNKHELILCAMVDRCIRGYEVEDGILVRKYKGHSDQVQQLTMLEDKGQYLSCSWDQSIRLWFAPKGKGKEARDQDLNTFSEALLEEDEEDEEYISTYERDHPLVLPMALRANGKGKLRLHSQKPGQKDGQKAMGESGEDKPKKDVTGLGGKLNELEDTLKRELLGKPRVQSPAGTNLKGGRNPRFSAHRNKALRG